MDTINFKDINDTLLPIKIKNCFSKNSDIQFNACKWIDEKIQYNSITVPSLIQNGIIDVLINFLDHNNVKLQQIILNITTKLVLKENISLLFKSGVISELVTLSKCENYHISYLAIYTLAQVINSPKHCNILIQKDILQILSVSYINTITQLKQIAYTHSFTFNECLIHKECFIFIQKLRAIAYCLTKIFTYSETINIFNTKNIWFILKNIIKIPDLQIKLELYKCLTRILQINKNSIINALKIMENNGL